MIIRDYLSCKDRTFLWKCSSLLKNLYLCPFEYEKLLIKNLIKEMKEQIQKKINDSKALRWGVLVLVAFTMLCGYFLTDVMSPLKTMLEKELLWDSLDYGIFTSAYGWFNVFAFMLIIGGIILDKMGVRFTGMGACILMVLGCGLKYYAISTTFPVGDTFFGMKTQVGLAALGYTKHLNDVCYFIEEADILYILNQSNLKALYLRCHGDGKEITDFDKKPYRRWNISYKQINGGYRFVYLDACLSALKPYFAKAFLGEDQSNKCFVGWNVSVPTGTSKDFGFYFWNLVRSNSPTILDAVLKARSTGLKMHPKCNPGFHGDVSFNGRSA